MKTSSLRLMLILVFAAPLAAVPCSAQDRGELGAGVVLGDPTGGTVKYWLNKTQALEAGVGFSGDLALWAGTSWHSWTILPQPKQGKLAGYLSLGGRLETDDDAEFGVRTLLGASYRLPRDPVEVFLEAGPVFRFTPKGGVEADVGLGLRYYFASSAKGG